MPWFNGQLHALYNMNKEEFKCSLNHSSNYIKLYRKRAGEEFLANDPLLPLTDVEIRSVYFGEWMVKNSSCFE